MQTLKTFYRDKHDQLLELFRYIVAGVLTTGVSLAVSYSLYFLFAVGSAPPMPGSHQLTWVSDVINLATTAQVTVTNIVSWIVAVLFAFWINRKLVFRVSYNNPKARLKAFIQFTSARIVTLLLFELGLSALLSVLGMPNMLARILVLVLVIVFNYIASKFWVFRKDGFTRSEP